MFIVWDFTGVTIPDYRRVVRRYHPGDERFQNEYCRVVWFGAAASGLDALRIAATVRPSDAPVTVSA